MFSSLETNELEACLIIWDAFQYFSDAFDTAKECFVSYEHLIHLLLLTNVGLLVELVIDVKTRNTSFQLLSELLSHLGSSGCRWGGSTWGSQPHKTQKPFFLALETLWHDGADTCKTASHRKWWQLSGGKRTWRSFLPPCSRRDLQDGSQDKHVGKDHDWHGEHQVKPHKDCYHHDTEVNIGAWEGQNWGLITEKVINFIGFAKAQWENKTYIYRGI